MPDTRITKKILLSNFNSVQCNPWLGDIKQIFSDVGMESLYDDLQICGNNSLRCVTLKLTDLAIQKWHEELHKQPKLRTYRLYKHLFETEDYVKINLTRTE